MVSISSSEFYRHPHPEKKATRIGNLIMLQRQRVEAAFKSGKRWYPNLRKDPGIIFVFLAKLLHYSSQRHDFLTQL